MEGDKKIRIILSVESGLPRDAEIIVDYLKNIVLPGFPSIKISLEVEEEKSGESLDKSNEDVLSFGGIDSSNVREASWYPGDRLKIAYGSGAIYQYEGVPKELAKELQQVIAKKQSVGKWINENIKKVYPYTKI